MNNTQMIEILNQRFACREFDQNKKIHEHDFNTILEAGRLSPSSFGFEPWKIIVIDDPQLRARIAPLITGGQKQLLSAQHFVIMLALKRKLLMNDDYMNNLLTVQQLNPDRIDSKKAAFNRFINSSFDLTDDRKFFDWTCKQTYFALSQMVLTSACLGIDSSVMEGFHRQDLENELQQMGIIDQETVGVAVLGAFGYRINGPTSKKRRPFNSVVEYY
jgi:nitroreductase